MWWLPFILCTCLCVTLETEAVIEKSFSRVEATQKYVTGSQGVTSARSKIDCARICRKYSHCISWAFDKLTSTCYLHPTVSDNPGDGANVIVYTDIAPACLESDAPQVSDPVTWQRTLTSFTSTPVTPTCPARYVAGRHTMRCLANGQWDTGQQHCKQHLWTNIQTQGSFPVPLTLMSGWTMCVTATPFDSFGFYFGLDTASVAVFHMSPRFGAPSHTIFDSNVGGWGQPQYFVTLNDPNPPFPFAVGRQFHMKIKAASDNLVQVDVDGSYYGTSNPTPLSIATVTKVTFSNVNVAELDLWCTP